MEEGWLPKQDICGSNPAIGNILIALFAPTVVGIGKTKVKKKRPRIATLKCRFFKLLWKKYTYLPTAASSNNRQVNEVE